MTIDPAPEAVTSTRGRAAGEPGGLVEASGRMARGKTREAWQARDAAAAPHACRLRAGHAAGRMSFSKMSRGRETVTQAFGMSTMELIRISMGATLRIVYACSPEKPNFPR